MEVRKIEINNVREIRVIKGFLKIKYDYYSKNQVLYINLKNIKTMELNPESMNSILINMDDGTFYAIGWITTEEFIKSFEYSGDLIIE